MRLGPCPINQLPAVTDWVSSPVMRPQVDCELLDGAEYFSLGTMMSSPAAELFRLMTSVTFDREQRAEYLVTVVCRDRGQPPLITERSLVVRVLDENDNAPQFVQVSSIIYDSMVQVIF